MFLVDHQANQRLAKAIGEAPDRLPIEITAHIHHGNALRMDWGELLPKVEGETFIFVNPPFIGQYTKTAEQTEDMKLVWGQNYDGYLDYVTGWHAKSMQLFMDRPGEFSFYTTNSITQGQPVPALFGPLFDEGWRIKFAHRTFAWDSQAPGQAAVHCVIIGFTKSKAAKQCLWDYPDVKGDPVEAPLEKGISPYLVDGKGIFVSKRSRPLSPVVGQAIYGSKPVDGGFLTSKPGQQIPSHDEIAVKYVRQLLVLVSL